MSVAVVAQAESRARCSMDRVQYERFLPLVRRTAMRLARRVPPSVTVGDLVGYGWVGLMEAYRRSATTMPDAEFEAYAIYRVRGAMLDYLRTLDPATRDLRRASKGIAQAIRDLSHRHGRDPAEEEIAGSMGILLCDYRALLEKIAAAGMARLELLDIDGVDVVPNDETVDDAVSTRRIADAVVVAMKTLSPKLLRVLALYYQEGCTLKQIGAVLGVSESRVSQLHTEAIHRLRAAVGRE